MKRRRLRSEIHANPDLDAAPERHCGKCGLWKPKEEFGRCRVHGRQRRCEACVNQARRKRQPGAETMRYRTDPEYAARVRARKVIQMRKRRGTLVPEPCAGCGTKEKVQARMPEPGNPNIVRWLCQRCARTEEYARPRPARPVAATRVKCRSSVALAFHRLAAKYANR